MGATGRLQKIIWSALLAIVSAQCPADGAKGRNWHMGKVLDSERSRYFAGTLGSGGTTGSAQTYGTYGTYQGMLQHLTDSDLQGARNLLDRERDPRLHGPARSQMALVKTGKPDGERAGQVRRRKAKTVRDR